MRNVPETLFNGARQVRGMSENGPLDGTVALVTGASAGIGRSCAEVLARDGADVALAARREERLEDVGATIRSEHGVRTLVVPTDVREETDVKRMVERTVDELGRLDTVVSNAGTTTQEDLTDFPTEEYRKVMGTNVDGAFFTTRAALPHLQASSGNLVFVGSFDGRYPRSFNPVYAASKWWLRGFAHSVEAVLGADDVAVTLVNPSKARTEIREAGGETFRERFERGEVLEPVDVAEVVSFACQQERSTLSEIDVLIRDKYAREGF